MSSDSNPMRPKSARDRLRDAWTMLRGGTPLYEADYDVEDVLGRRRRPPPPPQDALVPRRPPETPPRSGAIALPLPDPEEWDVDAYGRAANDN